MDKFEDVDWFTDTNVHQDPYPYCEYLRAKGPAVFLPKHNVIAVVDYDAALKVFRDDEHFSAINAVTGPFPPLPFAPDGDDITAQIEAHRPTMPMGALLMTMDRPDHARHRSLLMGLITPKRLKENEEFIRRLADRQIDTIIERGNFEEVKDLGHPLSVLVIADLLGVPESEHAKFLGMIGGAHSTVGGQSAASYNPLEAIGAALAAFLIDRRSNPQADVLTDLAMTKFPDGSIPQISELVTLAAFLFAAGQDTVVRLIGNSLKILDDNPQVQAQLRADPNLFGAFVEEALRFESPSKMDSRLVCKHTEIGGIDAPAGTHVMIMIGAANRDPKKFERPNEFLLDRPNVREHLTFGRGNHACVGAPLARSEGRIALERLFARTTDIRLSDEKHGPQGARNVVYPPRYTMRGPQELYVEVTPA